MKQKKNQESIDTRIWVLIKRLAGDKFDKVKDTANKLLRDGKKPERAWADALELHKCLPKPEVEA